MLDELTCLRPQNRYKTSAQPNSKAGNAFLTLKDDVSTSLLKMVRDTGFILRRSAPSHVPSLTVSLSTRTCGVFLSDYLHVLVVFAAADGVVCVNGRDEVSRDQSRALVNQLIEGVLAVCSRLAPHDRTGGVVDGGAAPCHISETREAGEGYGSGGC